MFHELLNEFDRIFFDKSSPREQREEIFQRVLKSRDGQGQGVFGYLAKIRANPAVVEYIIEYSLYKNCSKDLLNALLIEDYNGDNPLMASLTSSPNFAFISVVIDSLARNNKELLREILNYKNKEGILISRILSFPNGEELSKKVVEALLVLDGKDSGEMSIAQELRRLKKLSEYYEYANLTYSVDTYQSWSQSYCRAKINILKDLQETDILQTHSEKISDVIEVTQLIVDNLDKKERNGLYAAIEVNYENHAAFFIIKYNEEGKIDLVSYCDGNCPFSYIEVHDSAYSVCSFEVSPEMDVKEIEEVLNIAVSNYQELWSNIILRIAKDGVKTNFVHSIFSSVQKRGNCARASTEAAIKFLLKEKGWEFCEEEYDVDDIRPSGSGYDDLKEIKKSGEIKIVTNYFVEQDLSKLSREEKAINVDICCKMFLQAVKKSDLDLMKKLIAKLQNAGIDFDEIKNSMGFNAMFFVSYSSDVKEIFDWCYNECEIDLCAVDYEGKTALAYAIENNNEDFVEILIERLLNDYKHFFEDGETVKEQLKDIDFRKDFQEALGEIEYLCRILKISNAIELCESFGRDDMLEKIKIANADSKEILEKYEIFINEEQDYPMSKKVALAFEERVFVSNSNETKRS